MQLVVENGELGVCIYRQRIFDRGKLIEGVTDLNFILQTTLDEIFLQVRDLELNIYLDLNQVESFIFLEKILECECYCTYAGNLWGDEGETISNCCDEIFVDMEPEIQEIWDLRERMLYWLSYG